MFLDFISNLMSFFGLFPGYVAKPILFQPIFALFFTVLAVVGFYHIMFPVIVFLAYKYVRIVNKTYWMVEVTNYSLFVVLFDIPEEMKLHAF